MRTQLHTGSKSILVSCIALFVLLITSPGALLADDAPLEAQEDQADQPLYDLDTEQDLVLGSAYRLAAYFHEQTTLTWGEGDEAEVESDLYTECGVIANVLVTDVDAEGDVSALRCVISRLYLFDDELLPEGTVVLAERAEEGGAVYTVDGERIEDELTLFVLDKFVDVTPDDGITEEDEKAMLNLPEGPQPVGVQWEINAELMFGSMIGEDLDLEELEASGSAQLVKAFELFGVPALEFHFHMTLEGGISFFSQSEPAWDLLENEIVIEGTLQGPQQDGEVNDNRHMTIHVSQQWRDPEAGRVGRTERTVTNDEARRTLSDREREFLEFGLFPQLN